MIDETDETANSHVITVMTDVYITCDRTMASGLLSSNRAQESLSKKVALHMKEGKRHYVQRGKRLLTPKQ